ncbi:unnamed protein product [Acanthosepion pharaonis]|uniref:Uncharacterized protein n=1 Tax=Acanthosepion pharaonis TaxID=158019 RepID=A0A812CYM5_ACAPH|nr:unnamed protein product [Sepia pharaonis]
MFPFFPSPLFSLPSTPQRHCRHAQCRSSGPCRRSGVSLDYVFSFSLFPTSSTFIIFLITVLLLCNILSFFFLITSSSCLSFLILSFSPHLFLFSFTYFLVYFSFLFSFFLFLRFTNALSNHIFFYYIVSLTFPPLSFATFQTPFAIFNQDGGECKDYDKLIHHISFFILFLSPEASLLTPATIIFILNSQPTTHTHPLIHSTPSCPLPAVTSTGFTSIQTPLFGRVS